MPHPFPKPSFLFSLSLVALALGGLVSPFAPAYAEDWPQWRGPGRDGKSAETGLLQAWPAGGPPLLFKASGLGQGFSSLAVAGGKIYTMGDLGDGQYVLAFEERDGRQLWKTRIGPIWDHQPGGSRSTPTLDEGRLYVMSTEGEVVGLEADSGRELWRRKLAADYGGFVMLWEGDTNWKFAESPLVDGERVIVTPGTSEAALVAFDKKTGKELWRASMPELGERGLDGAGYASAVVSEAGGVRQYVQLLGRGVVGVDADSGRFLWGYNRVANDVANITTPVVHADYVLASTGYGTGAALLEIDGADGAIEADEVYFLESDTFQNHHGGMVLHDGYVYSGTGHNMGFPISVELETGKVAWGPERNEGANSAAVTYADGHVYFRYQNGLMILVEATPEGYREKGSFMIPDVENPSWSHPVIANKRLYLREQDHLFCYDIAAKPAAAPREGKAASGS